jgi:hypothetical protein
MYLDRKLSAAMWGRVQLLWLVLAIVALLAGIGFISLGNYVRDNIKDELSSQQISFPAVDAMSEEERAIDGIDDEAGKKLTTGDQAKIYSEYIGLHMREAAIEAGYPDATYATLGGPQREARAEVAAAEQAGDETAKAAAEEKVNTITGLRNTMLTGNNLRGNLLSAYGWDNVGLGVMVTGVAILVLAVVFFLLFLFERKRGHLPAVED